MSKSQVKRRSDGTFINSGNPDKKFKKGNNANPNGRRNAYTDLIKDFSFVKVGDQERRERVVNKLFQLAEYGDMKAIQFIVERLEGKAKEIKEVTHKDSLVIE